MDCCVYKIPSSISTLKLAQQPSNTNLYIYLNNEWNNKYCHFINKRASLVYHLTVAGTWVMFYTTLRKHCDEYDKTQLIINILRQRLSRIHYLIQNNNTYWPRLADLWAFNFEYFPTKGRYKFSFQSYLFFHIIQSLAIIQSCLIMSITSKYQAYRRMRKRICLGVITLFHLAFGLSAYFQVYTIIEWYYILIDLKACSNCG